MKFELTNYAKLWDSMEGRAIMHEILNNPELIKPNFTFWKEDFKVDPEITPSNAKGVANFISYMREPDNGFMMDMRAPLGDTLPAESRGGKFYTGSIPDYSARGYVETAPERMQREDLFAQYGDQDTRWLMEFATQNMQRMLNQANQTLSYQSAMLLSTGKITYKMGDGIKTNVIKAEIPKENFLHADTQAWTDPSAKILTQMIEMQDKIKDNLQLGISFQWQITKDMWKNIFMKNQQVLEWANNCRTIETGGIPMPNTYALPSDVVRSYLVKYEGLDPIVIVEEKQKDINLGVVHGWKDNIAVYRPVGYAGYIRRSTILDRDVFERFGNKVNSYNFTEAMHGCGLFMNSVIVNGNFKEWHSDFFLKAVPTLDEFLYHYIVDVSRTE